MDKIVKKIKYLTFRVKTAISILALLPAYFKDHFANQALRLNGNGKNIVFALDDESLYRTDGGFGREAYYCLKCFSDGGYNVYFLRTNDFRHYWRLNFLGRLIYKIKNLKFISQIPANHDQFIYAFDTLDQERLNLPWEKLIYINIQKSTGYCLGNLIPMPFNMMPLITAIGLDRNLNQYRHLNRQYRIFFGGSLNPRYYDSPIFKRKYPHLMTRLQGLRAVMQSSIKVELIDDSIRLKQFLRTKDHLDQLTIVNSKGGFCISPADWMTILGKSDFFLCFSGTDYPMCHNAIEVMSVGCIPIIAYSDWFLPHLEHGKNAIIYSNEEDLISKIKTAMTMPENEVLDLRKGVMEYYDQYLTIGRVAQSYEAQSEFISTLMLLPLLVSDEAEDSMAKQFVQDFENLNIQEKILR